jgi:hypothetical protein
MLLFNVDLCLRRRRLSIRRSRRHHRATWRPGLPYLSSMVCTFCAVVLCVVLIDARDADEPLDVDAENRFEWTGMKTFCALNVASYICITRASPGGRYTTLEVAMDDVIEAGSGHRSAPLSQRSAHGTRIVIVDICFLDFCCV